MALPRVVADIMTQRVLCLLEEENLELIGRGLDRFRFRHLPVIDGGKLVGIVSERDFLRASVSSLDPDHALKDTNLKRNIFVAEIMTRDVVSVRPDTPLVEAGRILRERRFGCLPVTDRDGTLVGIVTDSDFIRLALTLLEAGPTADLDVLASSHAEGLGSDAEPRPADPGREGDALVVPLLRRRVRTTGLPRGRTHPRDRR